MILADSQCGARRLAFRDRNSVFRTGGESSRQKVIGLAHERKPVFDAEFVKKQGDMKFDGAFGDIQFGRDFLVCEALKNGAENFLLTMAEMDGRSIQQTSANDFSGARAQRFDQLLICADHDHEVARRLLADEAMHREEVNSMVDRDAPIRGGFYFKAARARFLIEENENLRTNRKILGKTGMFNRLLVTSHSNPPFELAMREALRGRARSALIRINRNTK